MDGWMNEETEIATRTNTNHSTNQPANQETDRKRDVQMPHQNRT